MKTEQSCKGHGMQASSYLSIIKTLPWLSTWNQTV